MLLKGLVLEFGGRREDALFYYNAAAAAEPENMAVFCHKKRLTALLDHNEKEAAPGGSGAAESGNSEFRKR